MALEYWSKIPATVDGVLGGFGYLSDIDIEGSKQFMKNVFLQCKCKRALDCGAGIGRISKKLLTEIYDTVDIIEPDKKFIESVRDYIGTNNSSKIDKLYNCTLQDFVPDEKYSTIWIQWVLGHLCDDELVEFLKKCSNALDDNGFIIIKENVTSTGKEEKDDVDHSITRPLKQYLDIFKRARLKRIKQCRQTNFPEGIYPVYMFALMPSSYVDNVSGITS